MLERELRDILFDGFFQPGTARFLDAGVRARRAGVTANQISVAQLYCDVLLEYELRASLLPADHHVVVDLVHQVATLRRRFDALNGVNVLPPELRNPQSEDERERLLSYPVYGTEAARLEYLKGEPREEKGTESASMPCTLSLPRRRRPNLSEYDNRRTQFTDRYGFGIYAIE
jgi:hypothetical protein